MCGTVTGDSRSRELETRKDTKVMNQHQIHGGRRASVIGGLIAMLGLVVLAVVVTAFGSRSDATTGSVKAAAAVAPTTTTSPTSDLDVASLSKIARSVSSGAGDPTPSSAESVVTTRLKVLAAEGDAGDTGDVSGQVIVLRVHGNFTVDVGSTPGAEVSGDPSAPRVPHEVFEHFTMMTYTLTPDLTRTLDFAGQNADQHPLDLSSLGSVVDVPVG
jgi:hypothetical protein